MKQRNLTTTLVLSVFVIAVGWVASANAYENEPIGFDDLKWGSVATGDMTLVEEDPVTFDRRYTRSTDEMILAGVPVTGIRYEFDFLGFLYRVTVTGEGLASFDALQKHLMAAHGVPDAVSTGILGSSATWSGETTTIYAGHKKHMDPPAFEIVYTGTALVKSGQQMMEAALDFLEEQETEGEDEKEDEEDPWADLFD